MDLASVNLNHLLALDALLRERNVGRAAARMGVTQSAMSHTLRGLRELLDDPLLVRVGNAMVLTPFAEQTQHRLRSGLTDLQTVVSGRAGFDPSTVTDTFTFATLDPVAAILAGPVFRELDARAPRAKLRLRTVEPARLREQLIEGEIDVAFIPPFIPFDGLRSEMGPGEKLSYLVVCRQDHPQVGKRLTVPQYCKLEHVMLSFSGSGPGPIDQVLAAHERSRVVRVRTQSLVSVAELVASTDLVATTVRGIAEFMCALWPLRAVTSPVKMPPADGAMFFCWHPRFEAEPAHAFFLDILRRAAAVPIDATGEPTYARR